MLDEMRATFFDRAQSFWVGNLGWDQPLQSHLRRKIMRVNALIILLRPLYGFLTGLLTYMSSTLDELVRCGRLMPWRPDLGPRRMPKRRLFVTTEFGTWASALPATMDTSRQRLVSPAAEMQEVAANFVAGEKMISFIRRIDPPKGQGIIRINTSSFRLAGWCPAPQALVLAAGGLADATHGGGVRLSDVGKLVVSIRHKLGVTDWEKGEIYELFRAED